MAVTQSNRRRVCIHGISAELSCALPWLEDQIGQLLGEFTRQSAAGACVLGGEVRPYEQDDVLRHLSPTALPLSRAGDLIELYQEGERFWLIDERWGLAEMNLLKGQWRSWVLPQAVHDPVGCAEMAVLWPLAQLLRGRGLHLIPAASAVRAGWAALFLCPFGIEPELTALIRAGFRIIGQRWTAIRAEADHIGLWHMPGQVERLPAQWVDLMGEYCGAGQDYAACDAVVIIEPGRRLRAGLHAIPQAQAMQALRQAWPITELHPQRRHGQLPMQLAQHCRCCRMELSRNPQDLLDLLAFLRAPSFAKPAMRTGRQASPPEYRREPSAASDATAGSKVSVSLFPAARARAATV